MDVSPNLVDSAGAILAGAIFAGEYCEQIHRIHAPLRGGVGVHAPEYSPAVSHRPLPYPQS